ncbi:DASH complex subunit Dam1-domain-containing protein [Xylariaceae sp. FL1019]|nr:DASH complex subunit Dam1-domain-containing protein [Xylariaceae sp. FL1019]
MSTSDAPDSGRRPRSTSRSRPTTPLRPSSRSSFCDSAQRGVDGHDPFPLNAFEPAFAELSDAVADLEANMMHFQLMHESLARFGESFASFLYGLNMNAFCIDFPEVTPTLDPLAGQLLMSRAKGPVAESFRRAKHSNENQPVRSRSTERGETDGETTFMTTDMSFVDNPPGTSSSKPNPKSFATPEVRQSRMSAPARGGTQSRGRGTTGRGRTSGLQRPRARGLR